jgi:hypothetical protein
MNIANSPATAGTAPGRAGARRAYFGAGAVVAALGVAALTGCSAASLQEAGPGAGTASGAPAASAAPAASGASGASTAPATAGPGTATPPASASGAAPVLGRLAGVFAQGQGFGQARPAKIFNGGDPTGLVTQVTWTSWGGPQAIGSGTSEYVGPGQSVATGTAETATVVAFHLGHCHGTLMYRAVEWYFPQQGQAFDPAHYENVCTGSYVPGP